MSRYIDAFEFVRAHDAGRGQLVEGSVPLAQLARLLEGLPEQEAGAQARWQARADRGPLGEPLIRLAVEATLTLRCQRCLGLMAMPVESEVALQPVESEAELDDPDTFDPDEFDPEAEDFEKVLGSRKFDLQAQAEDELILSVPYVPRHDVCPEQPQAGADDAARVSPFAALAGLKSGPEGKK